jgi:hypothetical protein
MSKPKLGDWLDSINQTKVNMMEKDPSLEKSYPQWIVNKALSNFTDSILWANEMNLRWQLDKRLQYDFYINILRPRRRFSPWTKKESIEYLEDIKEYYGYSYTKSLAVLRILSKDDLEKIRKLLHKGGIG